LNRALSSSPVSQGTARGPRSSCPNVAAALSLFRDETDGSVYWLAVAVQLPGYIGDCDGNGKSSGVEWCIPGVYNMRMAQDQGVRVVQQLTKF
jgi:hypothetical protein